MTREMQEFCVSLPATPIFQYKVYTHGCASGLHNCACPIVRDLQIRHRHDLEIPGRSSIPCSISGSRERAVVSLDLKRTRLPLLLQVHACTASACL